MSSLQIKRRYGLIIAGEDKTWLYLIMNEFDRQNPNLWKYGIFYYNKNDTDLWVPKFNNLGWTVNFARPGAYVFIGLLIAIVVWMIFWF